MSRTRSELPFLVMCSGGDFYWTHAGQKAVRAPPLRGVTPLSPTSPAAQNLVHAADAGVGRVPNRFRAAVAKAMGELLEKARTR